MLSGGGDFALNRIIPVDYFRAYKNNKRKSCFKGILMQSKTMATRD